MSKMLSAVLVAATLVSASVYDKVGHKMYAGSAGLPEVAADGAQTVSHQAAMLPSVQLAAAVTAEQALAEQAPAEAAPQAEQRPVHMKVAKLALPSAAEHQLIRIAATSQAGPASNLLFTGGSGMPDALSATALSPVPALEGALKDQADRVKEQQAKPSGLR